MFVNSLHNFKQRWRRIPLRYKLLFGGQAMFMIIAHKMKHNYQKDNQEETLKLIEERKLVDRASNYKN